MRTKAWQGILIGGAAALLAIPLIVVPLLDPGKGSLEKLVDQARAAGLPTSGEAVSRLLAVPEVQNAGPLFRQAIESLPPKLPAMSELTRALPDEALAEELAPYKPALRLFSEAVRRPRLDFKRDWGDILAILFREMRPLQTLVLARLLEGELAARNEDWAQASQALADAVAAGWLIAQEPGSVAPLQRGLIEQQVETFLIAMLERGLPTDLVRQAILSRWPRARYDLIVAGEFWGPMGVVSLIDPSSESTLETNLRDGMDLPAGASTKRLPTRPYARRILTAHIQRWLVARPRLLSSQPAVDKAAVFDLDRPAAEPDLPALLGGPFVPGGILAAGYSESRGVRWKIMLSVVDEIRRRGRAPEKLPGPTTDPLTGQPFDYRPQTKGFTLASRARPEYGASMPLALTYPGQPILETHFRELSAY